MRGIEETIATPFKGKSHKSRNGNEVATFEQEKGDGSLSPLRSSTKWDDVH